MSYIINILITAFILSCLPAILLALLPAACFHDAMQNFRNLLPRLVPDPTLFGPVPPRTNPALIFGI